MESTKTIKFNGVEYNLYEITLKGFDNPVTVASDDLDLALMDALDIVGSDPLKDEAISVDNQIYCFMPEFILDGTEEKALEYFNEYFD